VENRDRSIGLGGLHALAGALVAAAIVGIFFVAPTEKTMGDVQRIVYIHVAVAWFSLAACLGMSAAAIGYLATRNLAWDHWSKAAAEVGWLAASLTLVTGSLWARAAWNTWWTWDPRLTTVFLLWAIYAGCLLVRSGVDEPHRAARLGAVLAVVALVDLPMVFLATRWFRGIHPAAPAMAPVMRAVLALSACGVGMVFVLLLVHRRAQLALAHRLESLELEIDDGDAGCGLCGGLAGSRLVCGASGHAPPPARAEARSPRSIG
jgi:heme exporter protein C